ncbi:MAG: WcbI family polysaccharide biosynthesis putative acetyltransferase [Neomegalonema sp.]|nr:WcbI family polysaccharide biosynthesis putative acetyltransferase [Neomegalonema sp.]
MIAQRQTRICVVSNCQAPGTAQIIRYLCPQADVSEIDIGALRRAIKQDKAAPMLAQIAAADHVLANPLADPMLLEAGIEPGRITWVPFLRFCAYHPDFVVAQGEGIERVRGVIGELQSLIALVGIKRGIAIERLAPLYSCERFQEAAGFFDLWASERAALISRAEHYGYDLRGHFARWVRHEPFMWSPNHPRIEVLADVVRMALEKIGLNPSRGPVRLPDNLARAATLPVYPPLAKRYGVSGDLRVKLGTEADAFDLPDLLPLLEALYRDLGTHTLKVTGIGQRLKNIEAAFDALEPGGGMRAASLYQPAQAAPAAQAAQQIAQVTSSAALTAPAKKAPARKEKPVTAVKERPAYRDADDARVAAYLNGLKTRKLAVISNCQVVGTANILRYLCPDLQVLEFDMVKLRRQAVQYNRTGDPKFRAMARQIEECDQVLASGVAKESLEVNEIDLERVTWIPFVRFAAFHPDFAVLHDASGNRLRGVISDAHSLIAFIGARRGLDPAAMQECFTERFMEAAGYFDHWEGEKQAMLARGEAAGFDLRVPFARWARGPAFMWSPSHPRMSVMAEVVGMVLPRLGYAPVTSEITVMDNLMKAAILPVYPPIAKRYGVQGQMRVKLASHNVSIEMAQLLPLLIDLYKDVGFENLTIGNQSLRIAQKVETAFDALEGGRL